VAGAAFSKRARVRLFVLCVCANNIQQKQVSLKLLLYCSFMSVILAHKKMFYFIRSFSFAPAAAVGVIHFVLQ
jgi:hypothetical protein